MKKYKAKDLYIIRPITLVKEKHYTKTVFPYNLYAKLGFIPENDVIKSLYDSEIRINESIYSYQAKDMTIATLDEYGKQYFDIFNWKTYLSYELLKRCEIRLAPVNRGLFVREKVLKPTRLDYNMAICELKHRDDASCKMFATLQQEISKMEFTVDTLREFKNMIISEEKDQLIKAKTELTNTFLERPFFSAFDKRDEIRPITKVKLKHLKTRS